MPGTTTQKASARAPTDKPRGAAPPAASKKRVVRRRGRGRPGLESDEEIEREAQSDSDSDDDNSSAASSVDSDTEPASENVTAPSDPQVLTPSTSKPPPSRPPKSAPTAVFATSNNWSDIVASEDANGPEELPVIDFTDLDKRPIPASRPGTKKAKQPRKTAAKTPAATKGASAASLPSPPLSTKGDPEELAEAQPHVSTSTRKAPPQTSAKRPVGQSARQAYQQRLETDPSYVPVVGEFWGHDDRLMDKELRSLSSWWRSGRGRGGRGFSRGVGRPVGPHSHGPAPAKVDLPPVERDWNHDGFEEMQKNDERKRQLREQDSTTRGRGRGSALAGRGRGSFVRGGATPSSPSTRPNSVASTPGRVWYAQKPQLMWTRQHDGYLHHESSFRGRHNHHASVRVRLPGQEAKVVRLQANASRGRSPMSNKPATPLPATGPNSDYSGATYPVRLPTKSIEAVPQSSQDAAIPAQSGRKPADDDAFIVKTGLIAPQPIPLPLEHSASMPVPSDAQPPPHIQEQLENLSTPIDANPARQAQMEEAVMRRRPEGAPEDAVAQTSDLPPPQPLAPMMQGSPYGYPSALPPGIAVNQFGMPFDIATGQPVYLPPPPPMFNVVNPRPMAPQFVPSHMRHHSSVEYPHSPVNGFVDPATGAPLFAPPRHSSAVQIRSPTGQPADVSAKHHRSSTLRTSAPVFQPTSDYQPGPSLAAPTSPGEGQQVEPPMVMYNPYQQYYYPEQYGYPQYMDMSHGGMYEAYPPQDQQIPMGAVYY